MNHIEVKRKQMTLFAYLIAMTAIILLANKIGDNGIAYFGAAMETYLLLFMITIAFIPDALARLIRTRMAKGQFKNADKIFKGALFLALFWGIAGGILLWLLAKLWMEKVVLIPYGAFSLQLLAPAFFISCCIAVLKGYFQGMGSAMPTVVSQFVKQICVISFGLILCFSMYGYGEKVAALLQNDAFKSMYGSGGMAVGISIAMLLALAFLMLVYMGTSRRNSRLNSRDGMRMTENCTEAIRLVVLLMVPSAAVAVLSRLPVLLGMILFQRGSTDFYASAYSYGSYYGKYQLLIWFITAFLMIFMLPLQNGTGMVVRREEYRQAKDYLNAGTQWVFIATVFFSVICMVLGEYLLPVIYRNEIGKAAEMLQIGGIGILFMTMGIFMAGILIQMEKIKNVILHLIIMLFVYVGVLLLTMKLTDGNVLGLVYAKLTADFVFCMLTAIQLYRSLRCSIDWLRGIVLPALCAAITGLLMLFLSKAIVPALGNGMGSLLCGLAGLFCYVVLLLVFRCFKEKSLYLMPGGKALSKIGSVLHLL